MGFSLRKATVAGVAALSLGAGYLLFRDSQNSPPNRDYGNKQVSTSSNSDNSYPKKDRMVVSIPDTTISLDDQKQEKSARYLELPTKGSLEDITTCPRDLQDDWIFALEFTGERKNYEDLSISNRDWKSFYESFKPLMDSLDRNLKIKQGIVSRVLKEKIDRREALYFRDPSNIENPKEKADLESQIEEASRQNYWYETISIGRDGKQVTVTRIEPGEDKELLSLYQNLTTLRQELLTLIRNIR
jgi:hypothetical protein